MRSDAKISDVDQERADQQAVMRHAFEGEPLNPEVACRVHERAAKVLDEIRRAHGVIDDDTFQELISDDE